MDCPSEENLIRLKLAKFDSIYELKFDLPNRYLTIVHDGSGREIDDSIASLNLGDQKMGSAEIHFSQGKVILYGDKVSHIYIFVYKRIFVMVSRYKDSKG